MLYQRLLGSAEALQKIIDIIPTPVFVKDTKHRWVLVNDSLTDLLVQTREALLGKSDFEVFPEPIAAAFWAADDELFATGQPAESEETLVDGQGRTRQVIARKTLLRVGPGAGTLFMIGVFADITAYREQASENHFLSRHDVLTGIANRTLFHEQLAESVGNGNRELDNVAVLLIDLDGFKAVNDAFGHEAGDSVLRAVAERLTAVVRAGDTVARLGGDEFGILLKGGTALAEAAPRIASEICETVAVPIPYDQMQVRISASVGITFYNKPDTKPEELMRQADIAMYSVKRSGRHGHMQYDPELDLAANRQLHADMRQALELHQLYVMYQPLWNPPDGELTGYEALLRWEHPVLGNISPGIFIPIAEQSGLIGAYGNFALKAACVAAMSWPAETRVAVNLSPVQLIEDKLVAEVREALELSGLPAGRLELEITESKPALDDAGALKALAQVTGLGVRMALDDFGSGTASLDMIHRYGFDRIKIDGRFVRGLPEDQRAASIVRSLIGLAHDLGAQVTAEGVERMEQAFALMELGCDEMQGFLFGHPAVSKTVL
jgi:diguanylate cyclase (GGDEF)-like protein/PAS domain S-box-containing protein